MQAFSYAALPGKVVFGFGTLARVSDEIRALGCSRAIVLSTPEQEATAQALKAQIGDLAAGIIPWAAMHTPTDVTERAMAAVHSMQGDCVVAVGGGSTTGLSKAIALRTDLPQIVIPTTYAGSEATPILGETREGIKTTQRSLKVLPEVILYDVDLTMTLPPALSATSGMNAIAHAAEALYSQDANPIISLIAEEGVRALASALPAIIARSGALYGAWACGVCLGSVGMALHHKLCHVLGGSFDLPHAPTHTVILPYAVAYNAAAAPAAMKRLCRALGAPDAAKGLFDLAHSLGTPTSLQAIGMPQEGLDRAADLAVQNPYWNPRPIERGAIRALLDDAYFGRAPSSS
ncbi:MAG: maleylacetate reductase [Pseudomonadota bacterium]